MQQWKLDRVAAIKSEVKELHPLLKQVFSADRSVTRFEYTHGNTEMGADFVLARADPTLGEEQYVGIIVKCGDIKQNFEDVRKQIDECKVERFFEGGKKKIYLSEIWIVTNGTISNGAERKIHEDYKSRNVRFIDGDKLAQLVDKHATHYWSDIPDTLAAYLNVTHSQLLALEAQISLLPNVPVASYISQDLLALETPGTLKVRRKSKKPRIKLLNAILENKAILIEGGMGAGKSSLFRRTAISFCTIEEFTRYHIVPKIIDFKEIFPLDEPLLQKKFADIDAAAAEFKEPVTNVLFIDGLDEVDSEDAARILTVKRITQIATARPNLRLVFGSRKIWTADDEIALDDSLSRFEICALTPGQMVQFLIEVCKTLDITAWFAEELTRSNIFRVLPRTPMSTVLLAKVMNAGLKELPQTLPELYSKYTELALGRWDAAKGLTAEKEYPLLASLVQQVAEYMLTNNLDSLSLSEVTDRFSTYLKTREDVPTVDEIIDKLTYRTDLIAISKQDNVFRFRHKTFLEYFYAVHLKENMGKAAPINNPFDGYWLGVEYFYLGLIQDAGERIDKLSRIPVIEERQILLKMINFGNLLLAAHRTEYAYIERGLYQLILEVGQYFLDVQSGARKSELAQFSKLQFLAILSGNLRSVLGFNYFKKALDTVSLQLECDGGITADHLIVSSFLVESVRASLGLEDAFRFLLEKSSADLDWVIRLGIHHVAAEEELKSDLIDRFEKKLLKMRRGNKGVQLFISELYEISMIDLQKKLGN